MQARAAEKQIHWAAKRGDSQAIERELTRGVDVDARDFDGETPLMCAAMGRHADLSTLKHLVSAGADVNALSESLQATPLQHAARSGRLERVSFLLASGADPRFVSRDGYTALTGIGDRQILEELLKAGANPDGGSPSGSSPIRTALCWSNFELLSALLEHGASRGQARLTPLMWAIALGTVEDVQGELRKGPDLAARDDWERTPWLLSVCTGEVDKAKLLLEHGAQLDDYGHRDWTSLMYAASLGREGMTRYLLDEGAEVEAFGMYGITAIHDAVMHGKAGCVRLLLEAGAQLEVASYGDRTPGPVIAEATDIETVRELLRFGADIDAIDGCGEWVLKAAAQSGDDEFVRQLLDAGAVVDNASTGGTALHKAAI